VKCSNERYFDFNCPADLVWDDKIKRCEWESSTCPSNNGEGGSSNEGEDNDSGNNEGSGNGGGNGSNPGSCVSSCENMKDGDYQSCKTCDGFVKCSNGRLFEMDCAPGGLVWDDNVKRCEWESSTCPGNIKPTKAPVPPKVTGNPTKHPGVPGSCVSSCENMEDGDYQSCKTCDGFVKCSNGRLFEMDCAAGGLVWDDIVKRCEWESSTCTGNNAPTNAPVDPKSTEAPVEPITTQAPVEPTTTQAPVEPITTQAPVEPSTSKAPAVKTTTKSPSPGSGNCVSSCSGMADGDYQACDTCDGFIKCSNERLFYFECAQAGLVWDDNVKRCEWESSTCQTKPETTKRPAGACVSSCTGMKDGDYQACDTCHGFIQCSSERLFYFECALGVWDDSTKSCGYLSSTCNVD